MTNTPNIVLVTVDSLRADRCGVVDGEPTRTPTLEELAERGVAFENAIAPGPSTPESMPAIFTGHYPVERPTEPQSGSELQRRRARIRAHVTAHDTLAERLSRRGYTTAAFTPNPFTSRYFGFDQGFDHFRDFMDEPHRSGLYERIFRSFLAGSTPSSIARMLSNFWHREEVFKPWESYYNEVVEWTQTADEPYFLWVFLMDAHNPYMAGSEYRTQARWKSFHANYRFWRESHETPFSETTHERLVRAYDDTVRYVDAFLERLQADLRGDDPVLVVHGDHGEAFGEHGSYGHGPHLHSENIHVPLVVSGNGSNQGAQTNPVSLRRLPELLGRIAVGERVVGAGSTPYATARTMDGDKRAIRGEHWHYVSEADPPLRTLDGQSIDSPKLETLCRRLLAVTREHDREHERVAGTAFDLHAD